MVAFDEFQSRMALKGMDGLFRSHLQRRGAAASFLFAGWEPRSLVDAGVVERGLDVLPPQIVDPLLAHWTRRHAGTRPTIFILPDPGNRSAFLIADGPSLAFVRQSTTTVEEAEVTAQRLLGERSGNIVVFDTDDPNDLPSWALPDER